MSTPRRATDGKERLFCGLTLNADRVRCDWSGRSANDYRTLGPTYSVRNGVDNIVRPKQG